MKQVLGIFCLLVAICIFNSLAGENFLSAIVNFETEITQCVRLDQIGTINLADVLHS